MSDDQIAKPKDDLERRKLLLEIADLERPWFRKPSSLAWFLPLAVALVSIVVGWRTGFFDNQRLVLEAQRHNLESQTRELRLEEKGLQGKRAALQAEVEQLKITLLAEREKTRIEGEQRTATLQKERVKATSEIAALRESVARQRAIASRAPVDVRIDQMRAALHPARSGPLGFPESNTAPTFVSKQLIQTLQSEPKLVPTVIEAYEQNRADPPLAAHLLRVLYRATGDTRWADRIVADLEERPDQIDYWSMIAFESWDKRDLRMLERLGMILARRTQKDRSWDFSVWSLTTAIGSTGDDLTRESFSEHARYFDILGLCRDQILYGLSGKSLSSLSDAPWEVLARLSSEAAIVITAVVLSAQDAPESARETAYIKFRLISLRNKKFAAAARELGVPEPTPEQRDWFDVLGRTVPPTSSVPHGVWNVPQGNWQNWVKDHPDLVTRWTDRDLTEARRLSEKSK